MGYGPGAERFNKALADLRILYEKKGKAALPEIREIVKSSDDPLVQQRAIGYIIECRDTDAITILEGILFELVKRVSFSTFGVDSIQFQTRLKAAHALAKLGETGISDRIWGRYDRLNLKRKIEVPYLLTALGDPKLTERVSEILNRQEHHQLVIGALNVLAAGGGVEALPILRSKVAEWKRKASGDLVSKNPYSPIEYSIWRIKAERAITEIEERT